MPGPLSEASHNFRSVTSLTVFRAVQHVTSKPQPEISHVNVRISHYNRCVKYGYYYVKFLVLHVVSALVAACESE